MGKNLIKIGAIFAVTLLLGSILVFSSTIADAATSQSYTISKNSGGNTLVKDSSGKNVYTSSSSQAAIQAAIDRTPSGGMVMINAGQYTLTGTLVVKAGVTLSGAGATTILRNGQIDVYSSNVVVKSLRMEGTCHLTITTKTAAISNVIVQDVTASVGAVESVFAVITKNYQVSNVQFIRDVVTNSGTNGFVLSGNALITGVTLDSCKVTGSGLSARFNDWVSGFVLAQNAAVSNVKAINCEASNNWENGFFLKPSVSKTSVVLQNCVANNNGQKTNYQEGYGYLLDNTVSMVNCVGTGNKGGLTNLATPPSPPPVTAGTSKITLTLAASSIETGKSMSVNGVLMGTTGIAGATVSLKVTLPDGTTANPTQGATATTDSTGRFAMNYVPTKVGTYTVTATFAGNSQFSGSSGNAAFSAVAAPTPPPTTTTYDYMVSGTTVKNPSGATVYTGSSFTAALQWAVSQANKVTYVPAGTYSVGAISMASGTTLMGAGDGATGTVFNNIQLSISNVNNVVLKQFRFTGSGKIDMIANGGTYGGHLLQDVTAYQTSASNEAAFIVLALAKGTMSGLNFIRCEALSTGGTGFMFGGDGWKYATSQYASSVGWVKNVYMEDCLADHCGYSSRYNPWVCGFDLAETCNIDNVRLVRCTALYSWESGFHLEWWPVSTNVVLEDCVANYNGAKPANFNNGDGTIGYLYGMGFYWDATKGSKSYMTLINCQGVSNSQGDAPNRDLTPSG